MSDEQQRALAVRSVAAVFMPIACVAVGLRCYVRGFIVKAFGWDDGAMVFAAVHQLLLTLCINGKSGSKLTDVRRCFMLCFRHA